MKTMRSRSYVCLLLQERCGAKRCGATRCGVKRCGTRRSGAWTTNEEMLILNPRKIGLGRFRVGAVFQDLDEKEVISAVPPERGNRAFICVHIRRQMISEKLRFTLCYLLSSALWRRNSVTCHMAISASLSLLGSSNIGSRGPVGRVICHPPSPLSPERQPGPNENRAKNTVLRTLCAHKVNEHRPQDLDGPAPKLRVNPALSAPTESDICLSRPPTTAA